MIRGTLLSSTTKSSLLRTSHLFRQNNQSIIIGGGGAVANTNNGECFVVNQNHLLSSRIQQDVSCSSRLYFSTRADAQPQRPSQQQQRHQQQQQQQGGGRGGNQGPPAVRNQQKQLHPYHRNTFRRRMEERKGGTGGAGTGDGSSGGGGGGDDAGPIHKQPFVTARLEPGEWDPERKDPLYRPKYRSNAKIISAEDYANRPMVMFEEEFETYADGMVTLGWIDMEQSRQIYNLYVSLMTSAKEKHGRTSHEYVTKLIAQRHNIAPFRAAAIIQLQHNEEQMRRTRPELLAESQARYAEDQIKKNIADAYRSERSEPPRHFVEDPVGGHGRGEHDETSSWWHRAEDVFDLQDKLDRANVRDEERARMIIDNHTYIEDVDDNQVSIKIDGNCNKLINAQEKLKEESRQREEAIQNDSKGVTIPYPETNSEGKTRDRYKFVAQMVDTRAATLKKRKQRGKRIKKKDRIIANYTNGNTDNTLVEQDGKLRIATAEEVKHVAWKTQRERDEFIYRGVKRAWIDHSIHGKTNVWGRAPKTEAPVGTATPQGATNGISPGKEDNEAPQTMEAKADVDNVADDSTTDQADTDGSDDEVQEEEPDEEDDGNDKK